MSKTRVLVLESLVEMLKERGLSYRRYDETRSDYTVHHLIDIRKNGSKLATLDIDLFFRFSEADMEERLDRLVRG